MNRKRIPRHEAFNVCHQCGALIPGEISLCGPCDDTHLRFGRRYYSQQLEPGDMAKRARMVAAELVIWRDRK